MSLINLANRGIKSKPLSSLYDVVIIGGATMGACTAWFLSSNEAFRGKKILMVERDMSFERSQTRASNNCMRQQFANPINVKIGQHAAAFVKDFRANLLSGEEENSADEPLPPVNIPIRNFGYLYMSDSDELTELLKRDQQTQQDCGAGTRMVDPDQISKDYPFYNMDDIKAVSLNTIDEGSYDAPLMVEWLIRKSMDNGVEYIQNAVTDIGVDDDGSAVTNITLETGERVAVSAIVNAAGTRAEPVAAMAGIDLTIEPRKRSTFIFRPSDDTPLLERDLPLTIDPTGVHFRQFGDNAYLVGCPPMGPDIRVDHDDFEFEEGIWENKLHPILSNRIPQFRDVEIIDKWMGHYDFNPFDCNVVVGPHSMVKNFYFTNGSSGHGSQQGSSIGRGVAEHIIHGEYRSMDLSPFSFDRFATGVRVMERAVI